MGFFPPGQNPLSHINPFGQLSWPLPGIPRGIEKVGSMGVTDGSGLFFVEGLHGSKVPDVLAAPQALHLTFWGALLSGGFNGGNQRISDLGFGGRHRNAGSEVWGSRLQDMRGVREPDVA